MLVRCPNEEVIKHDSSDKSVLILGKALTNISDEFHPRAIVFLEVDLQVRSRIIACELMQQLTNFRALLVFCTVSRSNYRVCPRVRVFPRATPSLRGDVSLVLRLFWDFGISILFGACASEFLFDDY